MREVQESPEPRAKRPRAGSPSDEMGSQTPGSPVVQSDYFGCSFKIGSSKRSDHIDHVARQLQALQGLSPEELEKAIHPKTLFDKIASEEQIRDHVLSRLDEFHASATCPT